MAEIKCYALTVPITEIWDVWMQDGTCGKEFYDSLDMVGVNIDDKIGAVHFLFRDPMRRKFAYEAIHEKYPDTMCAYMVPIAKVDEKYINKRPTWGK